ncbi:MarR family winged helix-turn-helix transcriptional regulator [Marinigracilibium pacificum]|uniref:MarR family transcriptional regulator n=1 Tax=Marinigracilibium pacificum TaxID=2729599 RepID=A0A848IX51_9BACT|nr:MarR family transcriptional regulator [Marinigracilibium pacificum]NMM46834.1 MarR family transcriptional regulator [Marinigracilibium pacificum]
MKIEEAIKTKGLKDNYEKVFVNIIYTSNWFKSKLKDLFKPYDITQTQYNVLRILRGKYPEPCNPGYITSVMIEKMSDVTRLIDRLIDKKLVERKVCESNRRMVEVFITQEGLELLEKLEPIVESSRMDLKVLTTEEADQLSTLLDKLRGQ